MTELKQLVAGLIRGKRSFEEVSVALDRYVASTPGGADTAARLLRAARKAGLAHHLFVALNGQLRIAEGQPSVTPAAGMGARASTPAGAGKRPTGRGSDPGEPWSRTGEATDLADAGLATAVTDDAAGEATVVIDDDLAGEATVFADDEAGEATVVTDDNDRAGEATVFAGDDEAGDATVVTDDNDRAGEATVFADDDEAGDATVVTGDDDLAGDATVFADHDEAGEATVVDALPDPDRTITESATDDMTSPATGARSLATGPARAAPGPSEVARTGPVPGLDRDFHGGDLLRGRFELISKLGEGGMGTVWKGKDKLKEEARDRNPFVAIKLLQGDFKSHPESFIALQRETAKQQRLAHPNIATVFDFDRDDTNGTVFMTMEVLEGQPLDAFIRNLPADGLREDEALPLIEQLCLGLGYAHKAGLVHSDLKPGNAFLTKEGTIKLLDFGIARASKTKSDAEGETTVFDPGQLGALTPTYAAIEMFEGEDPDPRDDIYALAIMAYQLLTGKHPYGNRSAPKAMDLGLTPEAVPKLNKAQNKGLLRGLAFHRADRPASVEDFLASIQRRKSRTGLWLAASAAVLAMAITGAWGPVNDLVDEREREAVIAVLQQPGLANLQQGLEQASALGETQRDLVLDDPRTVQAAATFIAGGGEQSVSQGLALIAGYPDAWQSTVKDLETTRQTIFSAYEARINADFSPGDARYAYPAAKQDLDELDRLYPDSAQVLRLRDNLDDLRNETLAELGTRYKILLEAGALVPTEGQDDISDVLGPIAAIDPTHHTLADPQLRFRFAEEVERAIQAENYPRADALLTASAVHAPDDPKLGELRWRLDRTRTQIANAQRVAELEARLGAAEPTLASLADYGGIRDQLAALANLDSGSAVLQRIQGRLQGAFDEALGRHIANGEWPQAHALLLRFARVLPVDLLSRHREALSHAEEQAGFQDDVAARAPQVRARAQALRALLAEPEFSREWETRLALPYKELVALQPIGSPGLAQLRTETANVFLAAAQAALEQQNFKQSREILAAGRELDPRRVEFVDLAQRVATAEEAFQRKRAEEQRLAQIENLEAEFDERAGADDVAAARDALRALRELGVDTQDPFLAQQAPAQLSQAYQRLAEQAAANDDFVDAARLQAEAVALDGASQEKRDRLGSYEAERDKRAEEVRLTTLFDSAQPIDVAAARASLAAIAARAPDRIGALEQRLATSRAQRLRALALDPGADVAALGARAAEFARLFPQPAETLSADLAARVQEVRIDGVDAGDPEALAGVTAPMAVMRALSPARAGAVERDLGARALAAVEALQPTDGPAAAALLAAAQAAFPGHAPLRDKVVPPPTIVAGREQLEQGRLKAAAVSLAAAKSGQPDHPDVASFESGLAERQAAADRAYREHVALAGQARGWSKADEIARAFEDASRLCSDCEFVRREPAPPPRNLCHDKLAGFGARRRGQCWDQVGGGDGPTLVVVPAAGDKAAFAIGRFEVSRGDIALFCRSSAAASGMCGGLGLAPPGLPATNLSAQQIQDYADWLSEEAGKTLGVPVTYRLPTADQWEYAARADGAPAEKDFNCRVMQGGRPIKGIVMLDASSGTSNGWGLANYVGNARELVRANGGFAARGGDYTLPLTECDVSFSEPHDGAAGETTGFRLAREL